MNTLIIDNAGFDVKEMAKLEQKYFVELHMSNQAICWGKTEEEKTKWLQDAHAAILNEAQKVPAKKEEISQAETAPKSSAKKEEGKKV